MGFSLFLLSPLLNAAIPIASWNITSGIGRDRSRPLHLPSPAKFYRPGSVGELQLARAHSALSLSINHKILLHIFYLRAFSV